MDRPGSTDSTRYGPLPTGGSSVVFSKSCFVKYAFERTGSWPVMIGSSRLSPGPKLNLTFRGPTDSAFTTWAKYERKNGWPFAFNVWNVQMTSSTVIGLPSWNRASGRSVNATQVRSAGISMLSAINPYSDDGSSQDAIVSVSNCCAAAAAATPFKMKGF